jgi:hypothetical protein
MQETPRLRRLRNDLIALERLAAESSIFRFKATGSPPVQYSITFAGKGLCRDRGKIKIVHSHLVEVKFGASYPRTIPEIRWLTPVYHPNISEIGMVCLGGYGTHWVPSVQLDDLCVMLWDMVRYHNYDIRSPYNRDAALWVANQTAILFPTDARPLRDLRAAQGRVESNGSRNGEPAEAGAGPSVRSGQRRGSSRGGPDRSAISRVRQFIERYGRASEPEPVPTPPPAPASVPAPGSGGEGAEDLTFALAPIGVGMTEARPEPVGIEPPRPAPAAPTAPAPAEGEFVFLEDDGGPPATPPPLPATAAGEDILFIE